MRSKYGIYLAVLAGSLIIGKTHAQDKFYTKSGKIEFVAVHDRDVNAVNRSAVITLDTKTGEFQFSVLINGFEFKKAGMQEKFNNQVLESDKFPKATFKGTLEDPLSVDYKKDGDYQVRVKGTMTLHGVSKEITAKGVLSINKNTISTISTFTLSIDDYNISNPGIGEGTISITVDCSLQAM